MSEAKETGKYILANFTGSDWCGWCKKLDGEVFQEAAFQNFAEKKLVMAYVDFPKNKPMSDETKAQNSALLKKFQVKGFPTILLLDAQGNELARTGYKKGGAESYVSHLEELLNKSPSQKPLP